MVLCPESLNTDLNTLECLKEKFSYDFPARPLSNGETIVVIAVLEGK